MTSQALIGPVPSVDEAVEPASVTGRDVTHCRPERVQLKLPGALVLDVATSGQVTSAGDNQTQETASRATARALPTGRGAVLLLVEGVTPVLAQTFEGAFLAALEGDRGTPASRLLRSVRAACAATEARAVLRHALTSLGATAVLIDTNRAVYAYVTQLPPCRAFLSDADGVRTIPADDLQRAATIASAAGRSWEVELEVSRTLLKPGAGLLVCTSERGHKLSVGQVADLVKQAPDQAVEDTVTSGRGSRAQGGRAEGPVIALRLSGSVAPGRAKLFTFGTSGDATTRSHRAPVANPALPQAARSYRLESWGLERTRRRGPVGSVLGALLGPPTTVGSASGGASRRWILVGLGASAAVAMLWRSGRLPFQSAPKQSRIEAVQGATVLPAAQRVTGQMLVSATSPFRAMAVTGRGARIGAVGQVQGLLLLPTGGAGAQVAPLPISGAEGAVLLAERDDDLLWLDAERGLHALSPSGQSRSVAVRGASGWQRPVAMAAYAGNLYVLDAGGASGQIWRHTGTSGGGYDTEPQPWVQAAGGIPLAGARDFAVDGTIWIAAGEAGILHLNAGRPEPFATQGAEAQIASAGAIYTEFGYRSLYVVDATARRLVQLGKDGRFERQVANVFPAGEHPLDLWVDEPTGRALVLTQARLQEVQIPR